MGFFGIFKPKWYKALPEPLKNIDEKRIKAIRLFQKKHNVPSELIFPGIISTPWAVMTIQYYMYDLIKNKYPKSNEKEIWKILLENRIQLKMDVKPDSYGPYSKPMSKSELYVILNDAEKIVDSFDSLSQVIDYIVNIEIKENHFADPLGISSELDLILTTGKGSYIY